MARCLFSLIAPRATPKGDFEINQIIEMQMMTTDKTKK
jgi:hypothetical protein